MNDIKDFAKHLSHLELSRIDQAVAFLWYHKQTLAFEERTASELAGDMFDAGLGRPNVTVLREQLSRDKRTIKGKRPNTFQMHVRVLDELNEQYSKFLNQKTAKPSSSVIPIGFVQGTKGHLEKLVFEINASYDYGLYDCCASMIRRLMESLIVEVFIHKQIVPQIRNGNSFLMLEGLINKFTNNPDILHGRNTPASMLKIKKIGDTASHDRTYILQPNDIDDIKVEIRMTIQELLTLSNIQP